MYSLEVRELTKRFGKTVAVKEVSFSLPQGESLAILGPPESGKTTLLRLIGGLEPVDRGRVFMKGEDVTDVPTAKRNIGMLFQHGYGLIPHMNVADNIFLPIQHAVMSKDGMKYRVTKVAHTLGISHLLERKVSVLSAGERLRVAMARALAKEPSLYLFDESLEQLDTPTRLAVRRELGEIQQTLHSSCLYTTSDQSDAFALSNRVAVINKGEIQQIGTRAELIQAPATVWVARWLGFPAMNTVTGYVQGTYQPEGICYRVWAKGFTPLLTPKWTRIIDSLQDKDIILGIRPESIIPEWELQEKWKPSFYTVKGEVLASEWYQGKTLVQIQVPQTDEAFMAIFDISHGLVKIGQILMIAFDPDQFCLFHPRTERLLQSAIPLLEPPKPPRRTLLGFRDRGRSN